MEIKLKSFFSFGTKIPEELRGVFPTQEVVGTDAETHHKKFKTGKAYIFAGIAACLMDYFPKKEHTFDLLGPRYADEDCEIVLNLESEVLTYKKYTEHTVNEKTGAVTKVMLPIFLEDGEFNDAYYAFMKASSDEEKQKYAALLSSNLDARLSAISDRFTVEVITAEEGEKPNIDEPETVETLEKGIFSLSDRELTEDEKILVPNLPKGYLFPDEVKEVCKIIEASSDMAVPYRNVMFRGPAGTGKTEAAKAIAFAFNRPYRKYTCGDNTEVSDLLGQYVPEEIDGRMVYHYIESDLLKAVKNGYVIEIQEPTVIARAGVLVHLNSILEAEGSITLPNGEVIEKHKDTVIIATTNTDYEGCRLMNQSVVDRFQWFVDLEIPDDAEVIKRLKSRTGFSNDGLLARMVECARRVTVTIEEEGIEGSCGMRGLIDWVNATEICGSAYDTCMNTLLGKAAPEKETRERLFDSCIRVSISPYE